MSFHSWNVLVMASGPGSFLEFRSTLLLIFYWTAHKPLSPVDSEQFSLSSSSSIYHRGFLSWWVFPSLLCPERTVRPGGLPLKPFCLIRSRDSPQMPPVLFMELLGMTLVPQFLAKWKKKKKKHQRFPWILKIAKPSRLRMRKQSHGNCREILTLPLVKPWAFVLSFAVVVWVWQASSGQGIRGRLGGSGARGTAAVSAFPVWATGLCTCAEGQPSLGTQAAWWTRERREGRSVCEYGRKSCTRHQQARSEPHSAELFISLDPTVLFCATQRLSWMLSNVCAPVIQEIRKLIWPLQSAIA